MLMKNLNIKSKLINDARGPVVGYVIKINIIYNDEWNMFHCISISTYLVVVTVYKS